MFATCTGPIMFGSFVRIHKSVGEDRAVVKKQASKKDAATRYTFRYISKNASKEEQRKLLIYLVNRAGLEPATR